jgi:hypothetical protein
MPFIAKRNDATGPKRSRRPVAFVSVIECLAAALALRFMTHLVTSPPFSAALRSLDRHAPPPSINSVRNHVGLGNLMTEARVERRLAAILAADVAGYSRLMGVDEEGTLSALKAHRRAIKHRCTTAKERRITRWEHEDILEAVQRRLDEHPEKMRQRRETVEHPFGTIKARMGATHFLMKTLPRVASEMALHVLAYNLTRVMNIMGIQPLLAAIRA